MAAPAAMQQTGLSSSRSSASSAAAGPSPLRDQQHRPQLQHLPIARDRQGKSPLQNIMRSLQSPRSVTAISCKPGTPKPRSPAAQLFESLTAEKAHPLQQAGEEKGMVSHLERCLAQHEALKLCSTWPDALQVVQGRWPAGADSAIVACEGSPTARALSRAFPECNPSKYSLPEAALSALEGRQVQRALLAVESSVHGTVHRIYDLLLRHSNVQIVGELVQEQRRQHVKDMELAVEEEGIKEYGRFWMLSRDACVIPSNIMREKEEAGAARFKTTVAMVLREGLGGLHKVLAAFAFRGIAVSKVESRPWRAQPLRRPITRVGEPDLTIRCQYVLFIDFEGSTASRAAQNALAQLQDHSSFLRVLGSYPCFGHTTSTSTLISPRPHQPPALIIAHQQLTLPNIALPVAN